MSSDPKKPFDSPPAETPSLLQQDLTLERRRRATLNELQVNSTVVPPAPQAPGASGDEAWQVQRASEVATPARPQGGVAPPGLVPRGTAAFAPTVISKAPQLPTQMVTSLEASSLPTELGQGVVTPARGPVPNPQPAPPQTFSSGMRRAVTSSTAQTMRLDGPLEGPPRGPVEAPTQLAQSHRAPPSPSDFSKQRAHPPIDNPFPTALARPQSPQRTDTTEPELAPAGGPPAGSKAVARPRKKLVPEAPPVQLGLDEPNAQQLRQERAPVTHPSAAPAAPTRARAAARVQEKVVTATPAALWRRLGAWLTDLLFISVVVMGLLVLAIEVIAPKQQDPAQQLLAIALPGLGLAGVLAFVYTALFALLWDGRTPGRRVMGIHLVTPTGEAPGPIRALVRAGLSLVSFGLFLAGFWLALFDRHGQTLHDKLTRTFVVKLQDA